VDLPSASLRESDLQIGQRVVYPNQGVCLVAGIETKEIGGVKAEFLTMRREEDGATVMVPRQKLATIGLRRVAQPDEIASILKFFEAEGDDPELDWKVRHRNHADKMTDGSLGGTAEVLKALHSLAERRPLPQKERELYDSARHLVVNEFAVALACSRGFAEDVVDFCLTPPAGSPRAQHKAKLKAEREAAEEAALIDGLDDLGELSDVAGEDVAEPESAVEESTVSPKPAKKGAKLPKIPKPAKALEPKVSAAKKQSASKAKAAKPAKVKPPSGAKAKTR
jgi:CarD family transcriptional regulator